MAKLTKELRDQCAAWLRDLSPSARGHATRDGGSCGHCVGTVRSLADALAACEVEAEPVLVRDAARALEAAGWLLLRGPGAYSSNIYARGNEWLEICFDHLGGHVTKTRYCLPMLLDGRLAALDEEAGR